MLINNTKNLGGLYNDRRRIEMRRIEVRKFEIMRIEDMSIEESKARRVRRWNNEGQLIIMIQPEIESLMNIICWLWRLP